MDNKTLERFNRHVFVTAEGCMLWKGARNGEYGVMTVYHKTKIVHRLVWEHYKGRIDRNIQIRHTCPHKNCCNIEHMIATHKNELRGSYNRKKTHCPQGHPYDPENTRLHRGSRFCRICAREYGIEYRKEMKNDD